jgi:hypothetical protein
MGLHSKGRLPALSSNIILEKEMFDTITSNTTELITAVKSMLQAAFKTRKNLIHFFEMFGREKWAKSHKDKK